MRVRHTAGLGTSEPVSGSACTLNAAAMPGAMWLAVTEARGSVATSVARSRHHEPMSAASGRALVGRDGEVEQLARARLLAQDGRVQVVVVRGEAGIGKTALIRRWTGEVLDSDPKAVVAVGHAVPLSGGPIPYGVASDLLSDLVAAIGAEGARKALGTAVAALAPLVPALDADGSASIDRFAVFAGSQQLLRNVPSDRLVVLVVEDLHWADDATLDLLLFWAKTATRGRLVIVATSRDRGEPVETLARLVDLEREASVVLPLRPLSGDAIDEQVAMLNATISRAGSDRVKRLSGGVPLYVEELVAAGDDPNSGIRLDLARRLRSLDESARRVLQLAALDPHPFDAPGMAAVAETEPEAVSAAVDKGMACGLLEPVVSGVWRFHHDLQREAVAASMTPTAALAGHRRWAEHLNTADDGALDDLVSAADHWEKVGRSRESMDALRRAARAASCRGNGGAMTGLVHRALELDYDGPPLLSPSEHDDLLGAFFASIPVVAEAAPVIGAERRHLDLAGDVRRAWLEFDAKTTAGTITGAEVVRLREVLVAHSSEQLAQVVMHTLIRVHIGVSEDRVEVLETLDKLLEMEEACGTNVIVERAEWMSFIDRDLTGEDHLAMWSEALDSCTGNDGQRPKAMARVIHGLVGLGRFQQARAHLDEFFEMVPEPVSSKWWYIVGRLAAQLNDLEGRWTEAERFYRAIADRGSFDDCLRLGLAGIASLAVRTGDRARLEEVMAEVDALPPAPGRGVIGYRERLVPDIVAAYACADSHPARAVDLLRPALQAMASGDEIRPAEEVVVLVARLVRRGLGSAGQLSDLVAQACHCSVQRRSAGGRLPGRGRSLHPSVHAGDHVHLAGRGRRLGRPLSALPRRGITAGARRRATPRRRPRAGTRDARPSPEAGTCPRCRASRQRGSGARGTSQAATGR